MVLKSVIQKVNLHHICVCENKFTINKLIGNLIFQTSFAMECRVPGLTSCTFFASYMQESKGGDPEAYKQAGYILRTEGKIKLKDKVQLERERS